MPKYCPIHSAGPALLTVLMNLLQAIADRKDKALVSRQEIATDEIYERRLAEAARLVKPLAALYFDRPRGISGIPDAGPPDRQFDSST